ncbi:Hypothetical predicted protein, partial [Mytilus galloprovincialis]
QSSEVVGERLLEDNYHWSPQQQNFHTENFDNHHVMKNAEGRYRIGKHCGFKQSKHFRTSDKDAVNNLATTELKIALELLSVLETTMGNQAHFLKRKSRERDHKRHYDFLGYA